MIFLSFERHSCPIYIPLVWKLLELSRLFYKILEKNDRTLLTTQYNLNIRLNCLLENNLSNCRRSRFVFIYETILSHIHNSFSLKFSLKRLDGLIDSFFVKLKSHNLDDLL